jgi:predicted membrane channel-forming protein YqfA (hemolysin III family)
VFCCCAATTHLLSSLTHVYPDDHFLEKLDHIGIVALIVGTPLTQMMVSAAGGSCKQLAVDTNSCLTAYSSHGVCVFTADELEPAPACSV